MKALTSKRLFVSVAVLVYTITQWHQDAHAESVEVDMATNDEPAKISCPCCQATLVIDRETLAILYVTEHRVKAGGASFEKSLQDLKDKEKQKSSRFQQAIEEEKQRKALLGKKFQELRKQADTNPDDRPPLRPFDLD
jgi:hypothetical protein